MIDYVAFDGQIEPIQWGKSTYTILRLPPEIANALSGAKRVEGEFNDHPVNLAITKAPVVDGPFLWAGKSLLDRTGLEPGEPFEARLRPVDPNIVEVPPDVTNALRSSGLLDTWNDLSAGKKRNYLHPIDTAKRAETRANRISKLLIALR